MSPFTAIVSQPSTTTPPTSSSFLLLPSPPFSQSLKCPSGLAILPPVCGSLTLSSLLPLKLVLGAHSPIPHPSPNATQNACSFPSGPTRHGPSCAIPAAPSSCGQSCPVGTSWIAFCFAAHQIPVVVKPSIESCSGGSCLAWLALCIFSSSVLLPLIAYYFLLLFILILWILNFCYSVSGSISPLVFLVDFLFPFFGLFLLLFSLQSSSLCLRFVNIGPSFAVLFPAILLVLRFPRTRQGSLRITRLSDHC